MEYLTADQVAKQWGVSGRRVRVLCNEGRINGAYKLGKQWMIPANATREVKADNIQSNKISIVTVGPMGPGIQISKYLLELGYRLCIVVRDKKTEEDLRLAIGEKLLENAKFYNGCLYDENFLDNMFDYLKDFTIEQIYFCEMLAVFNPAEENTLSNINMVMDYHIKGFMLACAKFYPIMDKTKLIFLIPKRAALKGIVDQTMWSCVWSGVVGFTESLRAACALGETYEVVNVYHGAILSEFWKMDALNMPVEIPVNFINPTDLAQLVVDTVTRKMSARVSELHFERLGVWKK